MLVCTGGRLDESRRERLHLRNALAAQAIIERNMREGPSANAVEEDIQSKQGDRAPYQAQAPPGPAAQGRKCKKKGVPTPRPPSAPSYALVVKQADGVSDQDALARVKNCVIENRSVHVKRMRVARSGGVVVELPSNLEKTRVKMSGMFVNDSMTVMEPRAPRPQLIIFDVPSELLGEGLVEEIRERNFPELAPEIFWDQVRVVTVLGNEREMLNKGRMYVGWMSCRVKESVNVPRCWECMRFGLGMDGCRKEKGYVGDAEGPGI
ncbi:hypothetical protein QAD02_003500 [Eretmocerus hayati]|uniref:Uncharacterized protein n=1 Tax=Eretmocerus hayati TaxID=131215 RepID=A0ACC2NMV2_9HYME|nr:hypothetical protein QAD02_003500 [Eretmocerus hayati]